ncbi:DUF1707 domain-containing protein [Nocardia sputi]|uniref:DUF1707 domain-containing protein n=1 Tax=Nocardia sputi TaxID=2943705 RepID=UPI001CBE0C89|nr:DUF1707 domain-containing protein [Nocardia sputi]UAK32568.1 DUF1707 domain-containing protein [Nocardia asteroides]
MSKDHVRASDADREKIVDQLRHAMNEGRLTLPEFDERLQQVYAAKTYGELTPLLSDLPAQRESRPARGTGIPQWIIIMWTPWVFVNALCVAIYLATGAGYFWPFWVAVPWGLALLIPTTIGIVTRGKSR